MIETALGYPYDEGDGLKAILIGSVLTLVGFLIVPVVFVVGYSLRVMRAVTAGEQTPPAWDEWGELFVDGLRGIAVTLVYFALPGIGLSIAGAAVFVPFAGDGGIQIAGIVLAIVGLVSLPFLLAALYVAPAALVGVAVTQRLGPAVAFGRLWAVVTTGRYATAWLAAFAVSLVATVLSGVLAGLTLIGGLLSPVVSFYAAIVSAHLYAKGVDGRFGGMEAAEQPAASPSDPGTGGV